MPEGVVKFFDSEKCYGFIISPDDVQVYVHAGDLIDLIRKNDRVNYDVEESDGKMSAFNVRRLNKKR